MVVVVDDDVVVGDGETVGSGNVGVAAFFFGIVNSISYRPVDDVSLSFEVFVRRLVPPLLLVFSLLNIVLLATVAVAVDLFMLLNSNTKCCCCCCCS